jgi:hypothetical protein
MVYSSQVLLAATVVVLLIASVIALCVREVGRGSLAVPIVLSDEDRAFLRETNEMKRRLKSEARASVSPAEKEKLRRRAEKMSRAKAGRGPLPSSVIGSTDKHD